VYDRDAIVAAVDLAALADELLGPHAGTARTPTWRCPSPAHRQTGRTPPVTVFTTGRGEQRWTCHGCGNAGTAIDLVMQARGIDVADALAELAHRSGIAAAPVPQRSRAARRRPTVAASRVAPPVWPQPVPALDRYVGDCAAALWRPDGRAMRRWLQTVRGLPDDVLRANRIGADLGPARQPRPDGIPRVRGAAVLPVSVPGGVAYLQLRLLDQRPGSPRYLNPASGLATNPRLGIYRPAHASLRRELIVTEGIIDALSAAAAGYRSAAILGAGYPDPATAAAIAQLPWPLVVAFDPDPAGTAGAERLARLLEARHRRTTLLRLERGDLNDHLVRHGPGWPHAFATAITQARHVERPGLTRAISVKGC
jgi:Toprim-like/CHC2 zinc finger